MAKKDYSIRTNIKRLKPDLSMALEGDEEEEEDLSEEPGYTVLGAGKLEKLLAELHSKKKIKKKRNMLKDVYGEEKDASSK